MNECKNCRKKDQSVLLYECGACGATICENCAQKTQNICPYCYTTLDYKI